MEKYYLYDIQNDERITEVSRGVYVYLYEAIFNIEALCIILVTLQTIMNLKNIELINSIETLVDGDFMEDENKIYKIIKVEA